MPPRSVAALLVCALFAACGSARVDPFVGPSGVPTFVDAESAFEWSAENEHLLLVFFTSATCASCWTFERDALLPGVRAASGDFALLRVEFPGIVESMGAIRDIGEAREREALSKRYRGDRRGLPDLVVVDPATRALVFDEPAPSDPGALAVFLARADEAAGAR